MKINNIGYNHKHDADFFVLRPEGSGDNLLLLLKTPAVFVIDGKEQRTEKNSFILFGEGTPQNYRSDGGEFANDWFHFSYSEEEKSLFEALEIPFDKVVEIGDLSILSLLIKNMSFENYSSNLYKTDSIELYLKLFFIKLSEKLHSEGEIKISSCYDKMSMLRAKIYSMPQNDWNIDGLAHELTMSRSHFEHTYKKIFGVSPMNEVINSRLEHAKFMLSTTDIPINLIAEICGYKSDIHFMRQFKSRLGVTPSAYRAEMQKQNRAYIVKRQKKGK
jgi:AraC family transcriptional regulator of arabinose operon